jgi:hypothetical protein
MTSASRDRRARALSQAIRNLAVLVDLDVHVCTFTTSVKPEYLGLETIPDGINLGRLELLPRKMVNKPISVRASAARALDEITLPSILSSSRLLENRRIEGCHRLMQHWEREFKEAAIELINRVPLEKPEAIERWCATMRQHYGSSVDLTMFANALDAAFPTTERLRKMYRFNVTFFQIEASTDVRIAALNEQALEARERQMSEWVNDTIMVVRDRVNKVAQHLADVLMKKSENGAEMPGLPERSRTSLLKQIEVVESLNFLGDPESARVLTAMKAEVSNEWAQDDSFRRLVDQAGRMMEAEVDSAAAVVIEQLLGQAPRAVEV